MNEVTRDNPAERAAKEALAQVFSCLENGQSFVLEAGAGAGKTYSLVHALRHLIKTRGPRLIRNGQRVACITFTNVAKDEIIARTDGHPAVLSETIHSFCWSLLRDFQPSLRAKLPSVGKWSERLEPVGGVGARRIIYDLGYPKVDEKDVLLGHDDVPALMVKLLEEEKFRLLLATRFPFLFIDEYQDTDKEFANALRRHFIEQKCGPLIGFFGDHWQQIYGATSCGKMEHPNLITIDKKANFRSEKTIVDCLNRMRPELPQNVSDPQSTGSVLIYHTNNWQGTRRKGGHWDGDLPADVAHGYLSMVRVDLGKHEWKFDPLHTKVLMLTHNVLADEQGYRQLAGVFSRTESYIKKEDDHIAFFTEVLEPVCDSYERKLYGEMFAALGARTPSIRKHAEKARWARDLDSLIQLRRTGTIGQVIEHLRATRLPRLPEKIDYKEKKYLELLDKAEADRTEEDAKFLERQKNLKAVPYSEVIALSKFIDDKTPFATKHGVKGAEFENVLVVCGRGWNQYNFNQLLEWVANGVPAGKQDSFVRNRNLFYVACSRPKKRLAILFTQQLSDAAIGTISQWFGAGSVQALTAAP